MKRGATSLVSAALLAVLLPAGLAAQEAGVPTSSAATPEGASFEGEVLVGDIAQLDRTPTLRKGTKLADLPAIKALVKQKRGASIKLSGIVTGTGALRQPELAAGTGDAALDAAILAAVADWQYAPPRKDGKPVAVKAVLPQFIGYVPQKLAGTEPELTEEMRRLGHHGTVLVTGVVQTDGTLGELTLSQASQSDLINAAALAAAASYRFEPPIGVTGTPETRPARLVFELSQAKEGGGSYTTGLADYQCRAFIAELDWWLSVNPDKTAKDYELRKFLIGLGVIMAMQKGDKAGDAMLAGVEAMNTGWDRAVEACRLVPGLKFMETFKRFG